MNTPPGLCLGAFFALLSKFSNPFDVYLCKYTNLLVSLDLYCFVYYYMYMFKYMEV